MEYNTTSTMNPTSFPTMDPGKICCADSVERKRTIQENLMETTDILTSIEAQIDRIHKFMWAKDNESNGDSIEITDMDTNIVRNLDAARRIYKHLALIAERLGC